MIVEFIDQYNRALVTKMDNSNFKYLGDLGLVMMIAVVDYTKENMSNKLIQKIVNTASALAEGVQDSIVFGHVDGKQYFGHSFHSSVYCVNLASTISCMDMQV